MAEQLLTAALEIQRRMGDNYGVCASLNQLALSKLLSGESKRARDLLDESFAISQRLDNTSGDVETVRLLGEAVAEEDYGLAERLLGDSLKLAREPDHLYELSQSLYSLGCARASAGATEQARQLFEESLDIAERFNDPYTIARNQLKLGSLAFLRSEADNAKELVRRAFEILTDLRSPEAETARRELARIEGGESMP